MMWLGYVICNVCLHYSSDIKDHFTLVFLSTHVPQSHHYGFAFIFPESGSFVERPLKSRRKSTFSHFHKRNVNKSINETIQHGRLFRLFKDKKKMLSSTRTKSLLPIHLIFLWAKIKGKSLIEFVFLLT